MSMQRIICINVIFTKSFSKQRTNCSISLTTTSTWFEVLQRYLAPFWNGKSRTKYCIFMQITLNNRVAGTPGTPASAFVCPSLLLYARHTFSNVNLPALGGIGIGVALLNVSMRYGGAAGQEWNVLQFTDGCEENVCSDYMYGGKINIDLHVQYSGYSKHPFPLFITQRVKRLEWLRLGAKQNGFTSKLTTRCDSSPDSGERSESYTEDMMHVAAVYLHLCMFMP